MINSSSVNTIQIWLIERDFAFHPTHAILRIGRACSQVDNTTSGGFACLIDMTTGRLQNGLDLKQPHV